MGAKLSEMPSEAALQRLDAAALKAEARAAAAKRQVRSAKAAWKKSRKVSKAVKKAAKLARKSAAAARSRHEHASKRTAKSKAKPEPTIKTRLMGKSQPKPTPRSALKAAPPRPAPSLQALRKARTQGSMPSAADVARSVIERFAAAKRQADLVQRVAAKPAAAVSTTVTEASMTAPEPASSLVPAGDAGPAADHPT